MFRKSERVFYFVRHGITAANQNKLWCGGDWDIDLHDDGRKQALGLADKILSLDAHFDKIFCSPMKRTIETANLINHKSNKDIEIVENLREWKIGSWEMTPWQSVLPSTDKWEDPPGGEAVAEFKKRTAAAITYCMNESQSPLIVSHGALGLILSDHLGIEERSILNCTLYKIFSFSEAGKIRWDLEELS